VLTPAYGKRLLISFVGPNAPANVNASLCARESAIFARIGSELVQSHANDLSRRGGNKERRPLQSDSHTDQVYKMRKLGSEEFIEIGPLPSTLDKQILVRCQRLHPLSKAVKKVFRICGKGLARDRLHKGKHILRAMVRLAHENIDLLLLSFAFGDIASDGQQIAICQFAPDKLGNEG
jgi:hypothetical protein